MSQRAIEDTATFTRTRYYCDVDGKELLQGAKPHKCFSCGMDLCWYHVALVALPGKRDKVTVCAECQNLLHGNDLYRKGLAQALKQYEEAQTDIIEAWRAEAKAKREATSSPPHV